MKTIDNQLKVGKIISIVIDLVVMFFWFVNIKLGQRLFIDWLIILSVIHFSIVLTAYFILNYHKRYYKLGKQQVYIVTIVSLLTLAMTIFVFLTEGDALLLFLLLLNGIILLSYPNKLSYSSEVIK